MADDKEVPKSAPVKLPQPTYSTLGKLADAGVASLRSLIASSPEVFKVIPEEVASMRVEALNATKNPVADPTLHRTPETVAAKAASNAFVRGAAFRHTSRDVTVTIVAARETVKNGIPMHRVIDENDKEFLARQDLLEKL